MNRTDALIWAAKKMLEQFRPMLDSTGEIIGVRLDLKIMPDGQIRSGQFEPRFEAEVKKPVDLSTYDFDKKLLVVEK